MNILISSICLLRLLRRCLGRGTAFPLREAGALISSLAGLDVAGVGGGTHGFLRASCHDSPACVPAGPGSGQPALTLRWPQPGPWRPGAQHLLRLGPDQPSQRALGGQRGRGVLWGGSSPMGRALPDHGPLTHALFSHYSGLLPAQLMGSPAPAIQHPKAYDERNV